jgi:hypothetical protein
MMRTTPPPPDVVEDDDGHAVSPQVLPPKVGHKVNISQVHGWVQPGPKEEL